MENPLDIVHAAIEASRTRQPLVPSRPDCRPHSVALDVLAAVAPLNPNHSGVLTRASSGGIWDATRALETEFVSFNGSMQHPRVAVEGYVAPGGSEGNCYGLHCARTWARLRFDSMAGFVVGRNTHHSVRKALSLLGLSPSRIIVIDADPSGRMDGDQFRSQVPAFIEREDIQHLTVVTTVGTTGAGMVDDVKQLRSLAIQFMGSDEQVWMHVDAALGGLLTLGTAQFDKYEGAWDSLVVDWHKFGQCPYGVAVVLVRSDAVSAIGEDAHYVAGGRDHALSGSRSGALAAAGWAVASLYGRDGLARLAADSSLVAGTFLARAKELRRPSISIVQGDLPQVMQVRVSSPVPASVLSQFPGSFVGESGTTVIPLYFPPHVTTSDARTHCNEMFSILTNKETRI